MRKSALVNIFLDGKATRKLLSLFVVFVMVAVAFAGVNLVFEDASPVQEAEAAQRNHIVINALLYNALTTESNNEWIELMNTHTATISLNDYMVGDEETKGGGEGMYEFPDGYELEPGQKCVIALKNDAGVGQGFMQLYGKSADFEIIDTDGTPDMVKVSTWATGSLALSNTADEVLLIRQSDEQVMDWVSYRTGATGTDIDGAMNSPDSSSAADNVAIERTIDGEDTNDCDVDFGDVAGGGTPQTMAETSSSGDTTPPDLLYAISTSPTTLEVHFNESVNDTDVEDILHWKIVALGGYDTIPPAVAQCIATDTTHVEVTYTEPVNQLDAEDVNHYGIDKGVSVTNAVLDPDLTVVNLTTSVQTADVTYTLTIDNVNDTASPPNVIDPGTQATFNGGGGGGTMTIVFIDIDQGDATLIISPSGKSLLVDAGPTGSGSHVHSIMTGYGLTHIDYTVATHYHEDHIGGLDEVISAFGGFSTVTGYLYDRNGSYSSTPYNEYATATGGQWYAGGKRKFIDKGTIIDLGNGVTAECMGVNGNGLSVSEENDKGVVLKVSYVNFDMYIAGDLGGINGGGYADVESTVMNDVGSVEVYQVDHHGSKYSSNSNFLSTLDPTIAVFSVGTNGYGHVHPESFDRINPAVDYMYYTNTGSGSTPAPGDPGTGEGKIINDDIVLTCDGSSYLVTDEATSFTHNWNCKGLSDTTPPTTIGVKATDLTHVEITFSESVDQATAENANNYAFDAGAGIHDPGNAFHPYSATLNSDLRTVTLVTDTQTKGVLYNITINNVDDRASPPNTIATDTKVQFTGGQPTVEVLSAVRDPAMNHIVYLTTGVTSRVGYTLTAYNVNDTAEPPNVQGSTSVDFVGGGYHLTINQIIPDPAGLDDDSEWWEIYNPELNAVDMSSWKFSDNTNSWVLPSGISSVPSGGYASFAFSGWDFYGEYGFYPDFEVFGDTASMDMTYTGSYHTALGNNGDNLAMYTSNGKLYDCAAWGAGSYGTITPANAPGTGKALMRSTPGREGRESVLASSPTGSDESTENQGAGVFSSASPVPHSMDSNPPAIEDVHWDVGSAFATIYWNTTETGWPEINPESDSVVVYREGGDPDSGANTSVSVSAKVTGHGVMLYPLSPGTTHYFYVTSTDGKGQTARDDNGGAYYQFTTGAADGVAPVISNVQVTYDHDSATITWDTDEWSTSAVFYGTTTTLGEGCGISYLTTSHSVTLSGLSPSTLYYFEVRSQDPSGNEAVDDNASAYYQFTTLGSDPVKFLVADMESFTGYSDGTGDPNQAYDYARNTAGLDALGIDDYSYMLTGGEYLDGKTQAGSWTAADQFVALYGQQLWDFSEGYGQIAAYDESQIATGDALLNLDDAYQWLSDEGAIGIFARPGYQQNFDNMAYNASADGNMHGLTVLTGYQYYDNEYYYNLGLRNGWHYGAIGGQRNYAADWGTKTNYYGNVDLTMIKTTDFTGQGVLGALRNHSTYAFEADAGLGDIVYMNFTCNGHPMGSEFVDTNELGFRVTIGATNDIYEAYLYEDGHQIRYWGGGPATSVDWNYTLTPSPGKHFYYVKAEQNHTYGATEGYTWSSPIWVDVPARSIPNQAPDIGYVTYSPSSPLDGQVVTVEVPITDDQGISYAWLYYRLDGIGSWSRLAMVDDGTGVDATPGDGTYTSQIPGQVDGSGVQFYVLAVDTIGLSMSAPSDAPTSTYSYYVGVRPLINEVFANPAVTPEDAEFIELYNPTDSAIPVDGWTIQDEATNWFDDEWMFPGGASVPANDYLVVGKSANEFALRFGTFPDYEMNNSRVGTLDMISVNGAVPIVINNDEDAIYLWKYINGVQFLVDGCEYGWHGVAVPGDPLLDKPANQGDSVSRDALHTDTDNCADDFFIINPATPGQNPPPVYRNVVQTPDAPGNMELVTVSCDILSDGMTGTPSLWYSVNGGAFVQVVMNFLGGVSWDADIPGQAAGFSVEYYLEAQDGSGRWGYSPGNYPMSNYSYSVWPHVVISEIYWNCTVWTDEVQHAAYVEVFNPTNTTIDLNGWELEGEPTWYTKKWLFPAAPLSVLGPFETRTIAKTAGGGAVLGFIDEFGFAPDFEMYDSDMTNEPYVDDDNPAVLNMDLKAPGSAYDDQLELYGPNYYDAIYLKNAGGIVMDAVEYGVQGENVPGDPYPEIPVGTTMHRNVLGVDTNDCLTDFFTATTPTPGEQMALIPVAAGWNFIAFPLDVSGDVASVLSSVAGAYDAVQAYDAATQDWKGYHVDKEASSLNDLTTLSQTMGIWLHMTSSADLVISGSVAQPVSYDMELGWNWAPFPLLKERMAGDVLASFTGTWDRLERYDSTMETYVEVLVGDYLQPCNSYIFHVTAPGTMTLWNE